MGRQPFLPFALMHATPIPGPIHREGWVYEEKVDGSRMVAVKTGASVELINRAGHDHASRFFDSAKALGALRAHSFILDGELAVFDRRLVSRFDWLKKPPTDEPATVPVYIAFDILELDGLDLRSRPLKERRRRLERLLWNHRLVYPARRLHRDGFKAWAEAITRGYEGLVAKDSESPYTAGRSRNWLKVKQRGYRLHGVRGIAGRS